MKLKEGIYEQIISNKIHEEIKNRENWNKYTKRRNRKRRSKNSTIEIPTRSN